MENFYWILNCYWKNRLLLLEGHRSAYLFFFLKQTELTGWYSAFFGNCRKNLKTLLAHNQIEISEKTTTIRDCIRKGLYDEGGSKHKKHLLLSVRSSENSASSWDGRRTRDVCDIPNHKLTGFPDVTHLSRLNMRNFGNQFRLKYCARRTRLITHCIAFANLCVTQH